MNSYIYNLGQAFYKTAELYPYRNALIYENGSVYSFRELNELSNQIARYLVDKKLKAGNVVAIFHDKSAYGFASMLACLKVGIIYVNLDYKSPFERLNKIISTCRPELILNDFDKPADYFEKINIPIVQLRNDAFAKEIANYESSNLVQTDLVCSSTPAYIMFTSGSTGFPKGATMIHQNLLNFIRWGKERYDVSIEDRFTNVNPTYFDNSVFDFYVSLFNGASLIPFPYEVTTEPQKIVERIDNLKATIWFSVPSMLIYLLTMKVLKKENLESLRIISFGGEGFPKPKLKKLFDLYQDRIRFINVYGPTECTCICSAYDISEKDFFDMENLAPLGKLAPNFGYVIIKENGENIGELCLTGPQVGIGYYNDTERTEKSFIKNKLVPFYNDIMYKTGDLVFEDEDGLLHFKGRKDNQIKHMGYRIELEEIESAFNSIPDVNESAVIYKKSNGEIGQICAFVSSSRETSEHDLLNNIKEKLPQYMIPKSIKILDRLPKNKNGKTDKVFLSESL